MPRPRKFDTDATIKAIRDTFWRKGFAGTSIQDLVDATGVRAGSLHAAFGNKDNLFRIAFEAYGTHFSNCMNTKEHGRTAIEVYMRSLLQAVLDDRNHRGCLIVQTAMESKLHAEEIRAKTKERLDEMRAFFRDHLSKCEIDDEQLVNRLFGATVSILSLGRSEIDEAVLRSIVDGALLALAQTSNSYREQA